MYGFDEDQIARRQERLKELAREAGRRKFTLKSRDGLVAVRVLATGRVVGLELDPRIYRNPDAKTLASTIMNTMNGASVEAARQHLRTLEEATDGAHGSFQELLDDANRIAERLFGKADDPENWGHRSS
jgi:DNA-binding protein YbaB